VVSRNKITFLPPYQFPISTITQSIYTTPKYCVSTNKNSREKKNTPILVAEFYFFVHKMGTKRGFPVNFLTGWLSKRSMKVKILLGILLALCAVVVLKHTITDPHFFYIASGSIHIIGLIVLVIKLFVYKTCSGTFIIFPFINCTLS